MKNDTKIAENVCILWKETGKWIEEVTQMGNQCAYTDRRLKTIIETADKLKKLYAENK